MIVVLDLETTGIPLWREPVTNPAQPRIVQIGVLHFDRDRRPVNFFTNVFERDGSVSTAGAKALHGISEGRTGRYGLSPKGALAMLCEMAQRSSAIASYDLPFDRFMIEVEMHRAFGTVGQGWFGPNRPDLRGIQIRSHAEQVVSAGKPLKLQGAHDALCEKAFEDRHNASENVEATSRILWALVDRGEIKL